MLQKKIRETRYANQAECLKYIDLLEKETEQDDSYNLWFINHNKAICYKVMAEYDKALKYLNKAYSYTSDESGDYYLTKWLEAQIYADLGYIYRAKRCYVECIIFFDKRKMDNYRLHCLFNYYELDRNANRAIEVMQEYEKLITEEGHSNFTKDKILLSMEQTINQLLSSQVAI